MTTQSNRPSGSDQIRFDDKLHPLSQELIIKHFTNKGIHYFTTDRGLLGATFRDVQFLFAITGNRQELLCISGQWHRIISANALELVRAFISDWHRDKLFPKAYIRIDDDGTLQTITEVTVDYEYGLTFDQLQTHIDRAVINTLDFVTELEDLMFKEGVR
ncbi:YbjN domain-containing protein [Canibacter zhoujuaniae]|uniref:YbjN domain-containing protein n=1 Tax=Canibacter zhoujuaniae TaxID=2708343 RepID=UPI00141DCA74|nr:YbjN domain-containing protein [Canibacter zhoujuaniae]